MTLTTRISAAARNAACDAIVDLIDGGAGAGYIEVRTGAQPATPATAASGTLLGTLTFSDPAFGAAAAGVATANAITSDTSADASGTAGWFRCYDSNAVAILDGSCGTTASFNMNFDDNVIVAGGTIAASAMTVTVPQDE